MKRIYISLIAVSAAVCMQAADTLTLNLPAIVDSYTQTEDGYWEDTYKDGVIEDDIFRFSHTGTSDGGGGMAYWEGFTLCTSGDTTNYGAIGSSDGWIAKQWGCMAGGGCDSMGNAVKDAPYLVAYWGFSMELADDTYHSVRVDFTDDEPHKCIGTWICNHPWPYYGNINGDGFASAFTKEGDYFALVAHGLNEQDEPTGVSVRLMLATYSNGALHQSADWQYMDLQTLGTVSGIYFTMETSDADALYGANTAVYFCMDRLSVLSADRESQELARPTGLKVTSSGEDSIVLTWNKVQGAEEYMLWLDSTEYGKATDTCYIFRDLLPYKEYTLAVVAVNKTETSDMASITGMTTDETAPTIPQSLQAEATQHSITLTWLPSEDNVGIKRYTVYTDGEPYKRTTTCSCDIVGLDAGREYMLEVEAEDNAGNKSEKASVTITTPEDTALEDIAAETEVQSVYTTDGKYVGNVIPAKSGIYIVRKNSKQTIIFIN